MHFLIDVRTAAEYREGHLPSSINLPLNEIKKIITLVPDMDEAIYLYCESGKYSGCARTVLLYLGYTQVYNLGSMEEASAFSKYNIINI